MTRTAAFRSRLARRCATTGFVAACAFAPGLAAATDPPIAAPGQEVPPHAAGGWPTDLTGDDRKPARTPEQQAHMHSVAQELKRIANTHGPDSVVLQSKFMMRSMAQGAVGATEVRVAGPSVVAGDGHLEIDVDTGIYFDETTTTEDSRREAVWKDVALPVLDEMKSFVIEPAALDLVFLFEVQKKQGEHGFDPTAEHRREGFRVQLTRPLLDEMTSDEISGDAVRSKVSLMPSVMVAASQPVPVATENEPLP